MKLFNFAYENITIPFKENADGTVVVERDGQMYHFESVQDLAEKYAIGRKVSPEDLKNWTLIVDGNLYSFVLRAATGGVEFIYGDTSLNEDELETPAIEEDDEEYEDDYYAYDDELSEEELRHNTLPYSRFVKDYEALETDAVAFMNGELESDTQTVRNMFGQVALFGGDSRLPIYRVNARTLAIQKDYVGLEDIPLNSVKVYEGIKESQAIIVFDSITDVKTEKKQSNNYVYVKDRADNYKIID